MTASIGSALEERDAFRDELAKMKMSKPDRTRVIALANQKGGVGKTTTTVNLAMACAKKGMDVMVIDMDSQGNATTALGIDHPIGMESMYEVCLGERTLAAVLHPCPDQPNLLVAPATVDLVGLGVEIFNESDRAHRLYKALVDYFAQHPAPDYIFIDCPPSMDLPTLNALVAADEVLIPLQAEYYSLEGLQQLQYSLAGIKNSLNEELSVIGILVTMFDKRNNLSRDVYDEVERVYPQLVFANFIPRTTRVAEAPSNRQTVIQYDPRSTASIAYMAAAIELSTRRTDMNFDETFFSTDRSL